MRKLLAPLVPNLPCAMKARVKHNISSGFQNGDLLHLGKEAAGYPAGTVLPVLGYCLCQDVNYDAYAVRAYVPGHGTTWSGREAQRFPTAIQEEKLFDAIPMLFTEIDITDCADALTLQRIHEAVVIPMYQSQAATMRMVA
jgi:hypothetical protein